MIDEESLLLVGDISNDKSETTPENKRLNFSKYLALSILITLSIFSIIVLRQSLSFQNVNITTSSLQMLQNSFFRAESFLHYDESVQTTTDVDIKGERFKCGEERVTAHCKRLPDKELIPFHDEKHEIIEYKNASFLCPKEHVSEVVCVKVVPKPIRSCKKGEYNSKVISNSSTFFICQPCHEGTYQDDPEYMGEECKPCPENTWVDFKGAALMSRCTEEKYQTKIAKNPSDSPVLSPLSSKENIPIKVSFQINTPTEEDSNIQAITPPAEGEPIQSQQENPINNPPNVESNTQTPISPPVDQLYQTRLENPINNPPTEVLNAQTPITPLAEEPIKTNLENSISTPNDESNVQAPITPAAVEEPIKTNLENQIKNPSELLNVLAITPLTNETVTKEPDIILPSVTQGKSNNPTDQNQLVYASLESLAPVYESLS